MRDDGKALEDRRAFNDSVLAFGALLELLIYC